MELIEFNRINQITKLVWSNQINHKQLINELDFVILIELSWINWIKSNNKINLIKLIELYQINHNTFFY